VDQAVITEEGIRVEGAIPVSILYISSDDSMPFAILEGIVPYSHLIEVQGLSPDCRFTLNTGLEQLSATMTDSEEIEVRAIAHLAVFVVRPEHQTCIHEIQEKEYDLQTLEQIPGITGYLVQEGDSLWKIAREYCLMPEQIMEMNGLPSAELRPGQWLVLMKTVSFTPASLPDA
jgi:LysM repeat protein